MRLSAEDVEGLAELRRGIHIGFDWGRGEGLPANGIIPLPCIFKIILAIGFGLLGHVAHVLLESHDCEKGLQGRVAR